MTRQQTQKLRNFKVKYLYKNNYPTKFSENEVCPCCGAVKSRTVINAAFQNKLKLLLAQYE